MKNEIELDINNSLFKDKIKLFYLNNKKKIILFFIIIVFTPILFQFKKMMDNRKYQANIKNYLKAEILIETNTNSGLKILKLLDAETDEFISLLAKSKLIEFYLDKEKKFNAKLEINKSKRKYGNKLFKEINDIKDLILRFDEINSEKDFLFLINKKNFNNFRLIKQKLLYDFYMKIKNEKKAKEVLKFY